MYKFVYFDGHEHVWTAQYKLGDLIRIAKKNSNVYQIVRNNRTNEVLWEREAPQD